MSKYINGSKSKWIIISILSLIVVSITSIALYINSIYMPLDHSKLNNISPTVQILDKDGRVIEQSLYINNSHYISIDALPQHTIDAFVSIEDKRFFEHNGLDYRRIAGAIVHNIQAGSFKEGASTITQQLIKNTHLDNYKTINRKVTEQLLAIQLEQQYSKNDILEMYLNTIYFGCNAYGIESASIAYFDKSASQLTISESATLAGMIKAPNSYNPNTNVDSCRARRDLVLSVMKEQCAITLQQYDEAINCDINTLPSSSNDYGYMYGVVLEACDILNMTPAQLANSSLKITTYYDSYAQQCLDNALLSQGDNLPDSTTAIMCNNSNSGIIAMSSVGHYTATNSRQIGSTIKPIAVYAPAIDMGRLDSASLLLDEKSNFGGYTPSNYHNKYHGWVTATDALSESMNVPAVKILNSIGVEESCKYLQCMGIDANEQDLSLALGNISSGMDIYQLAQCYTTLANCGKFNTTSYIHSIDNDSGNIYKNHTTDMSVYSESTAYIVTNMLEHAVSCGTGGKLNILPYDIACKTGTVGTSKGNSDALSCAYTSDSTMITWLSGDMDNSITGGTLPTQIIADTYNQYYGKAQPLPFTVPDSVTMASVDMEQLTQNQKVLLAGTHTKVNQCRQFPFAKDAVPTEYSKLMHTPTIESSIGDNSIAISIDTDMQVELHRVHDNIDQIVSLSNSYIDYDIIQGQQYCYYAKLSYCDRHIATTSTCNVLLPIADDVHNDNECDIGNADMQEKQHDANTQYIVNDTDDNGQKHNKSRSLLDIFYIGGNK